MNFNAVREQVETTFKNEFGAAYPAVPIQYENVRFKQPTGTAWVDLRIAENIYERQNVGGSKKYRGHGVVNVIIMVPEETGTVALNNMADKVFNIFADRSWSIAGDSLTMYGAEKQSRGLVNGFYCKTVQIDFRYETELDR